jgi:hypothetical protein
MVTPEVVGHVDPAALSALETNGEFDIASLIAAVADLSLVRSMTTVKQRTLLHS